MLVGAVDTASTSGSIDNAVMAKRQRQQRHAHLGWTHVLHKAVAPSAVGVASHWRGVLWDGLGADLRNQGREAHWLGECKVRDARREI